jgi:hypothetical protein
MRPEKKIVVHFHIVITDFGGGFHFGKKSGNDSIGFVKGMEHFQAVIEHISQLLSCSFGGDAVTYFIPQIPRVAQSLKDGDIQKIIGLIPIIEKP